MTEPEPTVDDLMRALAAEAAEEDEAERRGWCGRCGVEFGVMHPLKARVKNGQLVLDDPSTDLPEGTEVELLLVDELDPEERARLVQAIEDPACHAVRTIAGSCARGLEDLTAIATI